MSNENDVEMSEQEMVDYLAQFADTIYYQALRKLMGISEANLIVAGMTIDPFKEPTESARNQGKHQYIQFLKGEIRRAKNTKDKNPENQKV